MLFDLERDSIEKLVRRERQILAAFAVGAIVGTLTPLLMPRVDRVTKLLFLSYGTASSAAFTVTTHLVQRKERIYGSIDKAQMEALKLHMQQEVAYSSSVSKIGAQRRLAEFISNLPFWEHARWIQQFGLGGLIEPPAIEATAEEPHSALPGVVTAPPQSSLDDLVSDDVAIVPDYSWLDPKFICSTKAVFGARGSGKSTYLSFEAIAWTQINPDGELRIGDIHFDEEESKWLPGVSVDTLLSQYVATEPQQVLALFRRARTLLRDRVKRRDRKSKPFKFICDEFVGFISRLGKAEVAEVVDIIQENSFEARKYGVVIVLGLHSLKKGVIGIDSSALLSGMSLICLGNSIADPATRFPADFNVKALLAEQQQVASLLQDKQGRACVVRKLDEGMPRVEVLPYLDLDQYRVGGEESVGREGGINTNHTPSSSAAFLTLDQLMEKMIAWMQSLDELPSPEQVKEQWELLSGQPLTDDQLKAVCSGLGLKD